MEAGTLRVAVTDTGVGIPIADQPRVFERFSQFHEIKDRGAEGTGLAVAVGIAGAGLDAEHLALTAAAADDHRRREGREGLVLEADLEVTRAVAVRDTGFGQSIADRLTDQFTF